MCLLRGVDEKKEESERSRSYRALVDGQTLYIVQQLLESRSASLAVSPRPGREAEPFDDLERLASLKALDNATESGSEPAYIFVEGEIFFPCR
jgi:hypothetical protein